MSRLVPYLRLHGLHLIEQKVTTEVVLRVRVAATRYVTARLPEDLNTVWLQNPSEAVDAAREFIMPALKQLEDPDEAWQRLRLTGTDPVWDAFRNQRQLVTPRPPVISPGRVIRHMPITNRFDNLNRLVNFVHGSILVADAALQLWQNWRVGQENFRVVEARRMLLEDAVRATKAGQDYALQQALDPGNVQRYLAAGGDDPAYDILFGDDA